jgi:hypothetical protein
MKLKSIISLLLISLLLSSCNSNYNLESQLTENKFVSKLEKVKLTNNLVTKQQSNWNLASNTSKKLQLSPEAQLTSTQIELLKSLGLRIVVPGYVPPKFKLQKVEAELDRNPIGDGISYRIIYQKYDTDSEKDFCFAIEATNGGIGDLPNGERSYPINSLVLGKSTLEYGLYGHASKPTLLGNWLGPENGPFYRFVGTDVLLGLPQCDNISPQEAVRVSESLHYLP